MSGDVAVLGFHEGNAGQVHTWFEAVTGARIACFVHDADEPPDIDPVAENAKRVSQLMEYPTRDSYRGLPLLTSRDWPRELARRGIRRVLPLVSDNRERLRQIELARAHGLELVSAIHPTAIILAEARIEPGVWIHAGAIVGFKAELAAGAMLNTGAQVDHHSVLEACCHLAPRVVTASHVTIRTCAYIHTGASIINRREIGADAIVGAGAVVTRDIPARSTAVGVPARVIKQW